MAMREGRDETEAIQAMPGWQSLCEDLHTEIDRGEKVLASLVERLDHVLTPQDGVPNRQSRNGESVTRCRLITDMTTVLDHLQRFVDSLQQVKYGVDL